MKGKLTVTKEYYISDKLGIVVVFSLYVPSNKSKSIPKSAIVFGISVSPDPLGKVINNNLLKKIVIVSFIGSSSS